MVQVVPERWNLIVVGSFSARHLCRCGRLRELHRVPARNLQRLESIIKDCSAEAMS